VRIPIQSEIAPPLWRRVALAGLLAAFLPALAPAAQSAYTQEPADSLVRAVIENEARDDDSRVPYLYRLRRQWPERSETRDIVSTRDGLVASLVAVNDEPPDAGLRARDDARIEALLANSEEQLKRKRQQEKDAERVRKMIRTLPDAFLYEHDGVEDSPHGPLLRLKFRPRPEFDPPTRETLVFKGMEGFILLHERDRRLVKIDAMLVKDVKLGWGILAHLDKGGRFMVEKTRLPSGRWEIFRMTLNFRGKALLFKTIRIEQQQAIINFQPVPSDLTLAQGVALLRKQNGVVAEKK